MKITILTDNIDSWYVPFGEDLARILSSDGHDVAYVHEKESIRQGEVCFILSCSKILPKKYLKRNHNNIVVHASDLPQGKGFSPLQWQIQSGQNKIMLTLFEAVEELDAGPYYLKEPIVFLGTELYVELRTLLGQKINDMCYKYINRRDKLKPLNQSGVETFYSKRSDKDDEIDPRKSIIDHFNHLRIADNENHPVYFYYLGQKYFLKIQKEIS